MGKVERTGQEITFQRDIGQKATVERHEVTDDASAKANRSLIDIGQSLNPFPDNLGYMGSAAVHVFWAENLQQVVFISQTEPLARYNCQEVLAARAFDDLLGTLKQQYGHRRPKLRSGF